MSDKEWLEECLVEMEQSYSYSGDQKLAAVVRSEIDRLKNEVEKLMADLSDACLENGKIVNSSMKQIAELKDEVEKLTAKRSECKIIKGPEHTWHSGMCIYCGIFKVEVDDGSD